MFPATDVDLHLQGNQNVFAVVHDTRICSVMEPREWR